MKKINWDTLFEKNRILYLLGLLLIFSVFIITRLWRVDIIPNGLHIDEAPIAYDAWCLIHYGVDRHLKSWPVYLINYGGGQNVLYCYVLAGLFKIFGFSYKLIRVPAALFSLFILIFGMLLVFKIFHDKPICSLLAGGLVVICPYFIMASRFGLESSLMVGMSTVFLYCFVCAMETGRYRWYFIAGLTGGLVLYTYAISYIAVPIFLALALVYAIWTHRFSILKWLCMAVPLGILAFPLILEQYINAFDLEEMHLGIFTITKLDGYRISEIGWPTWQNFCETLHSTFIGDNLPYNSVPGYANLYMVTIPLVVIGGIHALICLIKSLKRREFSIQTFPFLWFLAMLFTMSCVMYANTNKVNGIFFSVIFLTVEGIYVLLKAGLSSRETLYKGHIHFGNLRWCRFIVIPCLIFYGIGFIRFGSYYFLGGYSKASFLPFGFDILITDAVDFLDEHPEYRHERTYMAQSVEFFALSTLISPYELMIENSKQAYDDYYYFCCLGEPEDGCNYIVGNPLVEYSQILRDLGYDEIKYTFYSLFYQKDK